jgi:hypothetical protein
MSSNVCHQIVCLAIELSSSSWVIAYRVPRNDKAKLLHRLEAGDGAGLLAFIVGLVTLATIGGYNILDRMRAACA